MVLCAIVFSLLLGVPAVAQEQSPSQPFALVEVGNKEVAVGKPVKVTVTLMVPTKFSVQPEFPDYDGINVIVKASEPDMWSVSKFINGTRWTGAAQTYWFYPMQHGQFVFENTRASGLYTDPKDYSNVTADFEIKGFTFSAVVPAGAEELNPLIVADALTLEQSWDGAVDGMKQGDAITRSLSANIEGSPVLFLPSLIQQHNSELIKSYPQPSDISENDIGKGIGGTRRESVTYIARYGGEVAFPDLAIRWFNTVTGEVETVTVKGRSVVIDAPAKTAEPLVTRKQVFVLLGLLLCIFAIGWVYAKLLHPALTRTIDELRLRWNTSELHAARKVLLAIREHDPDEVFRSILSWSKLRKVTDSETKDFVNTLLEIGKERFGSGPEADWRKLEQAFRKMRKEAKSKDANRNKKALPELNPF
jgi:hypothetical protein